MTSVSSEVHSCAPDAVPARDTRIPRATRWLAYMSTSRWQPRPPVHPAVAKVAAAMEAQGWMIRGAWIRNYLLWRNGRTMRERRLPLLILPLAFGRLSALQINVFLTVEIIEASSKFQRASDHGHAPARAAELQAVLKLVGADTGVVVADPLRLHGDAMHSLERMSH